MKSNYRLQIKDLTYIGLISLASFLTACVPGGAGAPKPRKKFPAFTSFGDFNTSLSFSRPSEKYQGLPFGGADLEFMTNGKFSAYTYIPMGDAQSDSLVMNLVNTYKPFAIAMLSEWNKQYRKGVLIDFRAKPGSYYTSKAFNLESGGSFSFPVVFIYDGNSASRASIFMQTMQNMPMISATAISSDKSITSTSGLSCF
jgi:hypothetical protein